MVDSPLRVMGLHSITYCPRLFYLEEVEGLQVEDEAVFSGRALHEILEKEEKDAGEIVSMEVGSERLGLTGKVDALRRRNGEIIPYEHKKGRSRKDGKKAQAWPADRIQVCAYGMLLEEALAKPVRECRVRYHADAVTVTLPLDEQARCDVMETLKRAQQLRECIQRPSISKNECQCIKCSLSLVCLPEEERFIEDPDWQPVRLFPPECDRRTLHILEHEARVSKCGDGLSVETPSTGKVEYPVHEIGAVCLHGYGQVTTQALHLCAANEVFVHYFTPGGRYVSTLAPVGIQVQRRIRQYHALADPAFCLELCRRLVMAKVENGLRYMLRATRTADRKEIGVDVPIQAMRNTLHALARANSIDSMRGIEGGGARAYFDGLKCMFRGDAPTALHFALRSRRPPADRFNALLSYGYSLLYSAVLQTIVTVGLESSFGFYHTPRSSAHPLVLDVMELFRQPIWDMPLVGSINRLMWDPGLDFTAVKGGFWLSTTGRKKAITLFEERLQETWRHPVVNYSLSYARMMELEVRLLEKEWTQAPGLFARFRLR